MQTPDTDYKTLYEESQIEQEDLRLKYNMLQAELRQLKQLIYGSKSERHIPENNNPSQLPLGIQTEAIADRKVLSSLKIEYTRNTTVPTEKKSNHPGRMKLPPHLERIDIIISILSVGRKKTFPPGRTYNKSKIILTERKDRGEIKSMRNSSYCDSSSSHTVRSSRRTPQSR